MNHSVKGYTGIMANILKTAVENPERFHFRKIRIKEAVQTSFSNFSDSSIISPGNTVGKVKNDKYLVYENRCNRLVIKSNLL